jgi:hypothetical protein
MSGRVILPFLSESDDADGFVMGCGGIIFWRLAGWRTQKIESATTH